MLKNILAKLNSFLSFETDTWKVSFFEYDPYTYFLLEFDYNFAKEWGSYSEEKLENKTLYHCERSVSFLVLFRIKIYSIRKKWINVYNS